jgi:hypothetical protein
MLIYPSEMQSEKGEISSRFDKAPSHMNGHKTSFLSDIDPTLASL